MWMEWSNWVRGRVVCLRLKGSDPDRPWLGTTLHYLMSGQWKSESHSRLKVWRSKATTGGINSWHISFNWGCVFWLRYSGNGVPSSNPRENNTQRSRHLPPLLFHLQPIFNPSSTHLISNFGKSDSSSHRSMKVLEQLDATQATKNLFLPCGCWSFPPEARSMILASSECGMRSAISEISSVFGDSFWGNFERLRVFGASGQCP